MRKIKKNNIVLCSVIFGVVILACCGCGQVKDTNISEEISRWNYIDEESGAKIDNWRLFEHIASDMAIVEGKVVSEDYPYGYNVGCIYDDVVSEAVLLTPGTQISFENFVLEDSIIKVQYQLHPWVASESDGAILNIEIKDENSVNTYAFEVGETADSQTILLEEYVGNNVELAIYVTNHDGENENCDWIVINDFVIECETTVDEEVFGDDGYVKSTTYYANEWPINFWNSEMDYLQTDMEQIKEDGFDSIIIVIPWREFAPGIEPLTYNDYAFENLDKVMNAASEADLNVYARIGYTWDYYEDKEDNIIDRFYQLLGDEDTQEAWYAYVEKMYKVLSSYDNFEGAFLTWEDFWNILGVCDEVFEKRRRESAAYIGYQAWVKSNYELEQYNSLYGTNYKAYGKIPVPKRDEPAMEAMYAFYDDFLKTILYESQQVFPNLSMEVRLDWELIYNVDGSTDYYKHTDTFSCIDSSYTATMYGIPMGFENVGERVGYVEAMEKTEHMLSQLKSQNGGKPVYIEQFIFADNTPKFKNNAQIKDGEINDYLTNVSEILLAYSEGYGIWTYRNYCANMLYNSQFALEGKGWKCNDQVKFVKSENGSVGCYLVDDAFIEQSVPRVRNHFDSEVYTLEFEVTEVNVPGIMEISVGIEKTEMDIQEAGLVKVEFSKGISYNVEIASQGCQVLIDNVKLYSQIQQGYLYDENNKELECIEGIRELNRSLK